MAAAIFAALASAANEQVLGRGADLGSVTFSCQAGCERPNVLSW